VITFTVDLEDPTERYDADGRYVAMTRHILNMLDGSQRKATFFTIGKIGESAPDLIKEIAGRGHEIAYHSHAHTSLTEEDPVKFKVESFADKDRLEQLAGKQVIGFRAPRFSLTSKSRWALDVLKEMGFQYSSSIMPTSISRFGFQNVPAGAFRWPNGLIELPLPVAKVKSLRIPYLGGIYLYSLPFMLTRYWAQKADKDVLLWTYTHPYDFDREEAFKPMPNTPLWVSLILWQARGRAERKLRKILAMGDARPFAERIAVRGWAESLPHLTSVT
jgi:polysaccharide deacetylase family protein (PEP-CTERM system associated)